MWATLAANGYRILWRVVVVIALCFVFYAAILKPFLKPNPTTTVESGGVNYDIKIGFGGCARLPILPMVKKVNDIKAIVTK